MPFPCAVLLSGSGRTLENLIRHIREHDLQASIPVVISSKQCVRGLAIAKDAGIPTHVIPSQEYTDAIEYSQAITQTLKIYQPEYILMCGFVQYYHIPQIYQGKVINIHPSLLPKYGGKGFYGLRVHRAVLQAGEQESGCTVHYVDDVYDHGNIIIQRRIPVFNDDTAETLASRVFQEECIAFPEALRLIFKESKK